MRGGERHALLKNSIKVAISVVWFCGSEATTQFSRLLGRPAGRFVVLYYHGVSREARPGFARQMEALSRGARVVPAGHTGRLPDGGRCVSVTFDDAFRSVRDHAVPELVSRGLPATIFVPVEFMGKPPAWDSEGRSPLDEEVMSAEELRALPELVEIGSHTGTHPHLPRLEDGRLQEEIGASKSRLAEAMGKPVTLLAFPYGEYDERAVRACHAAGYERVFAIDPRLADPRGGDFVRGRVAVEPTDSPLVFHLKARGAFAWMTHASALKARVLTRRHRR